MVELNRTVVGVATAGAAALVIGLGVSAVARADTGSPPSASSGATTTAAPGPNGGPWYGNGSNGQGHGNGKGHGWGPGGRFGGGPGRGGLGHDLSALATQLGVSESTLRDAMKGARDDLRSTQPKPTSPPTAPPSAGQRQAALDAYTAALAKRLGMDVAKVRSAIASVRAAEQADRQKAFDDRLAQAVKDGKLTQDEADAVKKAAAAGVIEMDDGPH
jgi:hypothetical protein